MNKQLEPIFARRSVRSYEDRDVPEDKINDLLEAAMAAPSAVAKDPWHFIVEKDKTMLSRIAEALPNGKMLGDAAVGTVVCGDIEQAHGGELSYLLQDCAAAIQNILLAASMSGLGACWLGVHPRQERVDHICELYGLPENIMPVSVIALGWPAENPEPRTRYDEGKVHWGQW